MDKETKKKKKKRKLLAAKAMHDFHLKRANVLAAREPLDQPTLYEWRRGKLKRSSSSSKGDSIAGLYIQRLNALEFLNKGSKAGRWNRAFCWQQAQQVCQREGYINWDEEVEALEHWYERAGRILNGQTWWIDCGWGFPPDWETYPRWVRRRENLMSI